MSGRLLLLVTLGALAAVPPETPRKPVTDAYQGISVTDDYRWLEDGNNPAVKSWIETQNAYSRAFLDRSPALPALRKRYKELMADPSPSYGGLHYAGGTLFAMKFQPPKEQPFLVTLKSADDPNSARVVLDPNALDAKGKTAIDFYVPSPDGKLVAVSLSEAGSEAGTVHVYEVATGKKLSDVVPRVQFPTAGGDVAWAGDGLGFFYTRYPAPGERPKEDANFYQQVFFHRLGSPVEGDTYELGKDFPRIAEIFLDGSDDGRYLLATVQKGDGGEFMHHLRGPDGKWTQLTQFSDQIGVAAFGHGETAAYFLSRQGAPNGKIIRLDPREPDLAKATVVVPAGSVAIDAFRFGTNKLYTNFVPTAKGLYVIDVEGGPSRVRFFGPGADGQPKGVPLPQVASVGEIVPLPAGGALMHVQTYLEPAAWYAYDPALGKLRKTALAQTSIANFSDCEVVREFATSKDGTKVPMSILRKKGTKLDGNNPTLLTGYGGYGVSQRPGFSPARRVWLSQGGVIAVANLRGGSEYGETWHKNGMLTKKQNVFDDFAACAESLIQRKYTKPERLAIEGGSNGGLLMGAALTQHPELFRTVVCHVGVLDMLRVEQHPNGAFNVTEYGTVKDPEQFKALYGYSPYHHVKDGTPYPAVFFLTGVNDGRVDPANSYKMAARLQAATASGRPVLLRVEFGSGHGIGDNLTARVDRAADVAAFLFEELGVEYRGGS